MLSLKKKIVFITGASSGIGKAAAEQFAAAGADIILCARRFERIESLAKSLKKQHGVDALALELDVSNKEQVFEKIEALPENWKSIDILVNNAGMARESTPIQDGNPDLWDAMFQTNVLGLLYVTKAILPGLFERNSGHIINIGSVAGREFYPTGNIYCATKHAVRALNQSLRMDLLGTAIRVSEVAPGAVHTEFSEVRWQDKEKSKGFYESFTPLQAGDIADTILYCASRPLHVNVSELVVYPVDQASCNHVNFKKDAPANPFNKK